MIVDLIFTILAKVEIVLLLVLGIAGLVLSAKRKKKYPRASRLVAIAGWLLLLRTAGIFIFGLATKGGYHAQSEAVAGFLVAIAIAVLFAAAFAFPDEG